MRLAEFDWLPKLTNERTFRFERAFPFESAWDRISLEKQVGNWFWFDILQRKILFVKFIPYFLSRCSKVWTSTISQQTKLHKTGMGIKFWWTKLSTVFTFWSAVFPPQRIASLSRFFWWAQRCEIAKRCCFWSHFAVADFFYCIGVTVTGYRRLFKHGLYEKRIQRWECIKVAPSELKFFSHKWSCHALGMGEPLSLPLKFGFFKIFFDLQLQFKPPGSYNLSRLVGRV